MLGTNINTAVCANIQTPVAGKVAYTFTPEGVLIFKDSTGTCYSVGGKTVSKTYAELKALYDAGDLQENTSYLISDYQSIHIIPGTAEDNNTNKVIPVQPLIVRAVSKTKLAPRAYSVMYPTDYIEYDITGDLLGTQKSANTKGWIYKKIMYLANGKTQSWEGIDVENWVVRRGNADTSSAAVNNGGRSWWAWDALVNDTGVLSTENSGYGSVASFASDWVLFYDGGANPLGYKDFFIMGDIQRPTYPFSCSNVLFEGDFPNMYIIGDFSKGLRLVDCNHSTIEMGPGTNYLFIDQMNKSYFKGESSTAHRRINNSLILSCTREESLEEVQFATVDNDGTFNQRVNMNEVKYCFHHCASTHGVADYSKVKYVHHEQQGVSGSRQYIKDIDYNGPFSTKGIYIDPAAAAGGILKIKNLGPIVGDLQATVDIAVIAAGTAGELPLNVDSAVGGVNFWDKLLMANIITFTGAGIAAQIDTMVAANNNVCDRILVAGAGQTITIPKNDVANGFKNSATITALAGEAILIKRINDLWIAYNL